MDLQEIRSRMQRFGTLERLPTRDSIVIMQEVERFPEYRDWAFRIRIHVAIRIDFNWNNLPTFDESYREQVLERFYNG